MRQGGRTTCRLQLLSNQVSVLVPEANYSVLDILGRMPDQKHGRWKVEVADGEFRMLLVFVPQFGYEIGVIRRSNRAPLVQKVENTQLLVVNHFKKGDVVLIRDILELGCQSLFLEQHLFLFEYFVQVYLMQPLVSVVNEQLLQAVLTQNLEPVDIQKTKSHHFPLRFLR